MWPRRGCAGGEAFSGGGGVPETPSSECQTWRSRCGVGRGPQHSASRASLVRRVAPFLKVSLQPFVRPEAAAV